MTKTNIMLLKTVQVFYKKKSEYLAFGSQLSLFFEVKKMCRIF